MSTYLNPNPPALVGAVGVDAALQAVADVLTARLPWLKVLGRAYPRTVPAPSADANAKPRTYPAVYDGALNDYYDALPNDNVQGQAFFTVADPVEPDDDWNPGDPANRLRANCSLVVWVNLYALDAARRGPWQEELHLATRDALASARGVVPGRLYQQPEQVLRGYTVPAVTACKWLMLPYAGFRLDFTLTFGPPC